MRVGFLLSLCGFPASNSGFRLGSEYLSPLSHFASPDMDFGDCCGLEQKPLGHARDLGPFSPLTEREKVQRDMGEMAQLVSCLMCGHEDPSSISSTHIKKLGVVDGCYHPSIEEAEGRIPPTHRPANLACLASSRPSEKLASWWMPLPPSEQGHLRLTIWPLQVLILRHKHSNSESLRNCEGGLCSPSCSGDVATCTGVPEVCRAWQLKPVAFWAWEGTAGGSNWEA